jgi:protein TonB
MEMVFIWIRDVRRANSLLARAAFCLALAGLPALAAPKEFSLGTEHENNFCPAQVLASPHPEIPADLHENCFKSCCIAKFLISPAGKTSVQILSSSGNEQLDEIALKTLKQWRFRPATLNGAPVESTKKIKIEFEVN